MPLLVESGGNGVGVGVIVGGSVGCDGGSACCWPESSAAFLALNQSGYDCTAALCERTTILSL